MGVFYDQCVDFSILGALFYIYPLTQNLCLFALSVDATVLINNAYKKNHVYIVVVVVSQGVALHSGECKLTTKPTEHDEQNLASENQVLTRPLSVRNLSDSF